MTMETKPERSALERKDRDELLAIARAMGASPPARARKADLVDLILEQVGVGSEAATGAATDATPAEAADPESPPGDEAAREPRPRGRGRADERGSDAPAADTDEAKGRGGQARDEGKGQAQGKGAPDDGEGKGGGDRGGDRSRGGQGDRGRERNDERGNERDADNDRGRGDQQGGDQGRGGQGGDDGEPGNRRRRRRGREGNRPDDQFQAEPVEVEGLLDLRDEGYGFLRTQGYLPSRDDAYVSVKQVRQFGLRKGDTLKGAARAASRNEKNPALLRIDEVNGQDPEEARKRRRFEDLTPLFPDERLAMEDRLEPTDMTARIIDLISPIGKGQRGLIVSPPKAGKTTVMKTIAKAIERNSPEVHLIVLLVDERPEEVTDMRRTVKGAEVVASTFDRPAEEHTAVAELVIERAKRMVEDGRDVVIILDGITRLARAYNLSAPATGRIMSGGVDSGALYPPKKFFGAARNVEEGGSLTILASALIETGSKMDEVIFEEFKGTGNMELRLDRRLAERRIYPALDVDASSTRHEELLFDRTQLQQVWRVRRALHALTTEGGSPAAAIERLIDGMKTFKSNEEFLAQAAKGG